jgi:TolA-binding protein
MGSLFLTSCDGGTKMREQVEGLESAARGAPSDTSLRAVLQMYNAYEKLHPSDREWNAVYQYRAAVWYIRVGNYGHAADILEHARAAYDGTANTPNILFLSGILYDEYLANPAKAAEFFRQFEQRFPDHRYIHEVGFYLRPEKDKLLVRLNESRLLYEQKLREKKERRRLGNYLIAKSQVFANKFRDDERAPEYLNYAGNAARDLGNLEMALKLWKTVSDSFPQSPAAPEALMAAGFTCENQLRNLERAKTFYETLLQNYPQHDLADDAQFSLKNLGKSPDAIIDLFEQKQTNRRN